MWRLAILAACVVLALSDDGLQLQVKPCSLGAIAGGNENQVIITWDKDAGECDYSITDASMKTVEDGKASGEVATSIPNVGRYRAEVRCGQNSEAMNFNTLFVQGQSEGKAITATAFPWGNSAYVSFSSSNDQVLYTCSLDAAEPVECTSPWHHTEALSSGTHTITINLSSPNAAATAVEAIESLTVPFHL